MKKILLLGLVILLSLSCTRRIVDFTIISTKNVDLSRASSFKRQQARITGEDFSHIIVFVPVGQANIKEAIDDAMEKIPGCIALVDGVVYTKFFYIPYIYGRATAIVEGTPLVDPNLTMNQDIKVPKYSILKLHKNGDVAENREVSMVEYYTLKNNLDKNSSKIEFKNSSSMNK